MFLPTKFNAEPCLPEQGMENNYSTTAPCKVIPLKGDPTRNYYLKSDNVPLCRVIHIGCNHQESCISSVIHVQTASRWRLDKSLISVFYLVPT